MAPPLPARMAGGLGDALFGRAIFWLAGDWGPNAGASKTLDFRIDSCVLACFFGWLGAGGQGLGRPKRRNCLSIIVFFACFLD